MSPTYAKNKKHIYNYIAKNRKKINEASKVNQRRYEANKRFLKQQTYDYISKVFYKILL